MTTTEYDIPDAIEKIHKVYDGNNSSINFQYDMVRRKVWFDTDPVLPVIAYGTPNKVTTNLTAIIAALDEDYEDVIFQYVRASALKMARDPEWVNEMTVAKRMASDLIMYKNRDLCNVSKALVFKDRTGFIIDDLYNQDGVTPNDSRYLESDL